jgi:prefoldin subunit 5
MQPLHGRRMEFLEMEFQAKEIILAIGAGAVTALGWVISNSVKLAMSSISKDFHKLASTVERLESSVQTLNVNMAVVVQKVEIHDRKFESLDQFKHRER